MVVIQIIVSFWMLMSVCAKMEYHSDEEYHKVIIIGAGMTGISTAAHLYDSGMHNFIVLEAQNYVGGRMKTIEFGGYHLNGGASWIEGVCIAHDSRKHGDCHQYKTNPMKAFADKYNITTSATPLNPLQYSRQQNHSNHNHDAVILSNEYRGKHIAYAEIVPTLNEWNDAVECANHIASRARMLVLDTLSFFFDHKEWLSPVYLIVLVPISVVVICGCWSSQSWLAIAISVAVVIALTVLCCLLWQVLYYYMVLFDDHSYAYLLVQCGWNSLAHLTPMQWLVQYVSFEFEYGAHPQHVSLHYTQLRTFKEFGHDELFVSDVRGYHGIIAELAQPIRHKIRLQHVVTKIEIIRADHEQQMIRIFTANQKIYRCKYLVVTLSIGALQSGIIAFYPKLPSFKTEALENYGMIDYTPVYIKWPYDFWSSTIVGEQEKKYILLLDERNETSLRCYQYILNLNHADFYKNSLLWRIDLAATAEALNVQYQSKDITMQRIQHVMSHYFVEKVPMPLDIYVAKWRRNKFVRGSYTNFDVGTTDYDVDKIKLDWHTNVHFSGSGLSHNYDGYVHGAYLEGQKMSHKLLETILETT